MNHKLVVAGLLLFAVPAIAHSQENPGQKITTVRNEYGQEVMLSSLGYMRIKFKDGTTRVKCELKELTSCCIVYVKDKVLHDVMIDKVKRIESENGERYIVFDANMKPVLR